MLRSTGPCQYPAPGTDSGAPPSWPWAKTSVLARGHLIGRGFTYGDMPRGPPRPAGPRPGLAGGATRLELPSRIAGHVLAKGELVATCQGA